MIKHLEFTYTTFALVFSSEFIGKAVSAPFWGRYSDNAGNLRLIKRVSYLIPLVPLLWLASSNVVYLVGVQLFSGMLWAGFDICSRRLLYTSAPSGKRAGYLVYEKSLITTGQALGALSAAGILGFMVPVMGQKILGMFVLSGIMRFAVARTMLPKIRVGAVAAQDSPTQQADHVKHLAEKANASSGTTSDFMEQEPYYCLEDKTMSRKQLGAEADNIKSHNAFQKQYGECNISAAYVEAVTSKRGLFFRPQDWAGHTMTRKSSKRYKEGTY
jgi:MFS family permease